ncbi:hypothetical protein Hanom_Chr01g00015571 [Helianthus anomalus]
MSESLRRSLTNSPSQSLLSSNLLDPFGVFLFKYSFLEKKSQEIKYNKTKLNNKNNSNQSNKNK